MNPSHRIRFVLALAVAMSLLASCDSGSNSSNSAPISTGNSGSMIPWNSSITYGSLTYAGQTYKTVVIGTQTWMAENLNYKLESSWCYENSADSCSKNGRLYNWAAAMGLDASYNAKPWSGTLPRQGICPSGWHLPSNVEWTILADYIGDTTTAGRKLKSASGWENPGNGTDSYGFRALAAGGRNDEGVFIGVVDFADFWSSSDDDADDAWYRYLFSGRDDLYRRNLSKKIGNSVRCLKD